MLGSLKKEESEKKEEGGGGQKVYYNELKKPLSNATQYKPYESILPSEYQYKRKPPKIKGKERVLKPDLDSPSLLKGMPTSSNVKDTSLTAFAVRFL